MNNKEQAIEETKKMQIMGSSKLCHIQGECVFPTEGLHCYKCSFFHALSQSELVEYCVVNKAGYRLPDKPSTANYFHMVEPPKPSREAVFHIVFDALEKCRGGTRYAGMNIDSYAITDQILALTPDWLGELTKEIADLKLELSTRYCESIGETWYWQGDGEDHLESTTCPIIIPAEQLRQLIATPEVLSEEEIRQDTWRKYSEYLINRGEAGLNALPENEQGFWKGYWQSMVNTGNNLKG